MRPVRSAGPTITECNSSPLRGPTGRWVFKPTGATSYTTVKKVYANGSGDLRTTVKASKTGTRRWAYYGNTTTGPSTSAGDNVVVK